MSHSLSPEVINYLDHLMRSIIITHPLVTKNQKASPKISIDELAALLREGLIQEILKRLDQMREIDAGIRVIDVLNDPSFRRFLQQYCDQIIFEQLGPNTSESS